MVFGILVLSITNSYQLDQNNVCCTNQTNEIYHAIKNITVYIFQGKYVNNKSFTITI